MLMFKRRGGNQREKLSEQWQVKSGGRSKSSIERREYRLAKAIHHKQKNSLFCAAEEAGRARGEEREGMVWQSHRPLLIAIHLTP